MGDVHNVVRRAEEVAPRYRGLARALAWAADKLAALKISVGFVLAGLFATTLVDRRLVVVSLAGGFGGLLLTQSGFVVYDALWGPRTVRSYLPLLLRPDCEPMRSLERRALSDPEAAVTPLVEAVGCGEPLRVRRAFMALFIVAEEHPELFVGHTADLLEESRDHRHMSFYVYPLVDRVFEADPATISEDCIESLVSTLSSESPDRRIHSVEILVTTIFPYRRWHETVVDRAAAEIVETAVTAPPGPEKTVFTNRCRELLPQAPHDLFTPYEEYWASLLDADDPEFRKTGCTILAVIYPDEYYENVIDFLDDEEESVVEHTEAVVEWAAESGYDRYESVPIERN
jgi:hypothetical protein